jgi:hypothetical protein
VKPVSRCEVDNTIVIGEAACKDVDGIKLTIKSDEGLL